MNFFVGLAVAFYVTMILFMTCLTVLFVLNVIPLDFFNMILGAVYQDEQLRIIVGSAAVILIFLNYVFSGLISGNRQRERTIAFDNPSGRVLISLRALEDLVKRLISQTPEIKEARSSILASRRGLNIEIKTVFRTDVNIPETTSRLQEMVKNKIQDTIGIDEKITVRVFVSKILNEPIRLKQNLSKLPDEEKPEPNIPFHGYRA